MSFSFAQVRSGKAQFLPGSHVVGCVVSTCFVRESGVPEAGTGRRIYEFSMLSAILAFWTRPYSPRRPPEAGAFAPWLPTMAPTTKAGRFNPKHAPSKSRWRNGSRGFLKKRLMCTAAVARMLACIASANVFTSMRFGLTPPNIF